MHPCTLPLAFSLPLFCMGLCTRTTVCLTYDIVSPDAGVWWRFFFFFCYHHVLFLHSLLFNLLFPLPFVFLSSFSFLLPSVLPCPAFPASLGSLRPSSVNDLSRDSWRNSGVKLWSHWHKYESCHKQATPLWDCQSNSQQWRRRDLWGPRSYRPASFILCGLGWWNLWQRSIILLITKLLLMWLSQRGSQEAEDVEQVHLGVEGLCLESAATIDDIYVLSASSGDP